MYTNLPLLNVQMKHDVYKIRVEKWVYCEEGGKSTPVIINLKNMLPMDPLLLEVIIAPVWADSVKLVSESNPISFTNKNSMNFFSFTCGH